MLYQSNVFWEDQEDKNALQIARNVLKCDVIDFQFDPLHFKEILPQIKQGQFRGALDLAKSAGMQFSMFNALNWLPALRRYCVNNDAYFLDMHHIVHEPHVLFSFKYGAFIRPVSPFKEFAGNVYNKERFVTEYNWLKQNNGNVYEMCVIASPKNICAEWRCVFINNEFISSSQYMKNGEPLVVQDTPNNVIVFAKEIASHNYFINKFDYVIDVGQVNNELKLVEINAIETSSFYACDIEKIYKAMNYMY